MNLRQELCEKMREEYRGPDGIDYVRVTGSYEAMISIIGIHLEVYFPDAFQSVLEKVIFPSK